MSDSEDIDDPEPTNAEQGIMQEVTPVSEANTSVTQRHHVSPKGKRSRAWLFWEHPRTGTDRKLDKSVVVCKLCGLKKRFFNSTTMLMDHLSRKHYNALVSATTPCSTSISRSVQGHVQGHSSTAPTGEPAVAVASTAKESPGPGTIKAHFMKMHKYHRPDKRSDTCDRALAFAIIRDLLPLSECEGEGLKYFAETLDPRYSMPGSKYLKNNVMLPMYHETKMIIKAKLQKCDCIALTTDTWSSLAKQNYISLTAHLITDEFELQSYLLETKHLPKSHKSENLIEKIQEMIEEWGIGNKHLIFVTDNASDIKKAVCELGGYEWLGCFAHTLNLSIGKSLKIVKVKNTVIKCSKLVSFFQRSNKATQQLKDEQGKLGMKELTVLKYVKTRWNSVNIMLERLYPMLPAVCSVLITCNKTELIPNQATQTNMKELSDLLGVFEAATVVISAQKTSTISFVKPMINSFNAYLNTNETDSFLVKKSKKAIKNDLQTRYQEENLKNLLNITSLLDPRFKDYEDINNVANHQLLINMTVKINSSQNQSTNSQNQDLSSQNQGSSLQTSSSLSQTQQNKFSKLRDLLFKSNASNRTEDNDNIETKITSEFTRYMSEPSEPEETCPVSWWKSRSSVYPNLARTARYYLCVPATSVPSERAFSLSGNIISKKRVRLHPDNVNMLCFLHANYRIIPQDTPIHHAL